ncbi:hypothetical protein [Pelomonas sp. SE-A7]|uniref:hypothetical protein n=1 Tax=Pelomonas sp. SE-A7 TaxID=3054953 RepID=UPI00259CE75B|nr:hypothetical protein [Pelomonas sp. SE-A7]MDM4764807.1 hypothetical protein [Pelomonas sp. SE-A7]
MSSKQRPKEGQGAEPASHRPLRNAATLLVLLAGCSTPPKTQAPPVPTPVAAPKPPAVEAKPPAPAAPPPHVAVGPKLPPPGPVRNHDELRRQAAQRLMVANPDRVYGGVVPPILLAIPVLEVELHADGSIKKVDVLRRPGQAPETLQMAIDALHRAAPFGDVSRLPRPWKFSETFLFNNERRFKPRTLDI